ncbi:ATP-binding cassette domain-containing protein [Lacticaseibacillus brantae]|uniref:ABC superfamily ATP binding cassette transporter, ABC protein n=1 Tax=Lacticaseibacillus brantae DSM 23927 TaxID=1423727 RepID=A0A0R2AY20_9LACO|nr:ATP-binding cassette domain-containing protein [Lacticaseibacillus brantae]KRM71807.1 ABC superfamily ATP binding cassette transporter, ABC protein [Lacticaseibacillus brantae DSM 23927]
MSQLTIEHLNFSHPKHPVFDDVSISFENPGLSVILGKNGIGKSTLLDLISHLEKPTSGDFAGFPPAKDMMYVFQSIAYSPDTTGAQLMAMYQQMNHPNPDFTTDDDFYKTVITPLLDRQLDVLSGGELTVMFVYASAAIDKALYLFDEPLSGVDPQNQTHIVSILDRLGQHKPVIVTSHIVVPFQETSANFKFLTPAGPAVSHTYAELTHGGDTATDLDIFLGLSEEQA